ncbi:MAG: hypothetical protein LKE37_11395 [Atopobiaceae bacterium]|jgi:hypothetical protein|nr:hypothetical protein [Atopobiaceae bacterium]
MSKVVKVTYVLVIAAVATLIFVGHARIKLGSGMYALDYVCDTLIAASTVLGTLFFRTREKRLSLANATVLALFVIESVLYYGFGSYQPILFATTDYLVIALALYVLSAKRLDEGA